MGDLEEQVIGNCKDCKHWGGPVDRLDNRAMRSCQALTTIDKPDKGGLVTLEVCSDHEHYGVGVRTKPLFGCVLFEAKEEANAVR